MFYSFLAQFAFYSKFNIFSVPFSTDIKNQKGREWGTSEISEEKNILGLKNDKLMHVIWAILMLKGGYGFLQMVEHVDERLEWWIMMQVVENVDEVESVKSWKIKTLKMPKTSTRVWRLWPKDDYNVDRSFSMLIKFKMLKKDWKCWHNMKWWQKVENID